MPQLVKGGKHVFGWAKVSHTGEIPIPAEALEEYQLRPSNKVIIINGSKTSGGFSMVTIEKFLNSPLSIVLENNPKLATFQLSNGESIQYKNRFYCWTEISQDGKIQLPIETLKTYGINPGALVLSVRGSGLGVGFIIRGPIIKEAEKHPELAIVE
jgi:bifunctional DNA-binding transcriptional regulator/antitoxin component of YhaV-PrlF toxin-antitoxin module